MAGIFPLLALHIATFRRSQPFQIKKALVMACTHKPGQALASKQNSPKTRRGEELKFVNWYLLFLQPSSQVIKFQDEVS